jgi:L-lactate dehydrogenase
MTLYDPSAFGGSDDFLRQMDWIGDACRSNPPRPGMRTASTPGDRGMALKARQEAAGISLHPSIAPMLRDCAAVYGLAFPEPA